VRKYGLQDTKSEIQISRVETGLIGNTDYHSLPTRQNTYLHECLSVGLSCLSEVSVAITTISSLALTQRDYIA